MTPIRLIACNSAHRCPGIRPGKPVRIKRKKNLRGRFRLALFDYLRKSRAQGFVVSLSGGADSSTVAVLVHLFVQLGGS